MNNIPKLRFKEFTDEWQEKKLGDLADIKGGKRIPKGYSLLTKDNGLPYLTVSGMKNNSYDYNEVRFVPVAIADQIKNYKISIEDIYVSVAGTLGLVGIIPDELDGANLTENANKLTNIKANRNFILQYLKSDRFGRLVKNVKTDNAQPKLAIYALQSFKMIIPKIKEQEKTASFLMAVDEKINLLEKKKKGFEKYKKGVVQAIFSQKLRFNNEKGNNYPNWDEKKLGEIAKTYQPVTISQNVLTEDGYLVYGANGIIGKYSKYNHELEQIAVTCRGNTCGTVNYTQPKSWITGNAMIINLDDSELADKRFVYYQLTHQNLNYLIAGSGQPQITGNIKEHKIMIPSLLEQVKIVEFLTLLDKKIDLINKNLEQARLFKKSLLQQMFV